MKAHVQNPWTRSPSLMVNMSVEEVQQLEAALEYLKELYIRNCDTHPGGLMNGNQQDALNQLRMLLEAKLGTDRPNGIKGCSE